MKKNRKTFHKTLLALTAISALGLNGCLLSNTYMRDEVAMRVAHPAWMKERQIPAAPFSLTAYERIHENSGSANVYIEGDGLAWLSRNQWSLDPTPKNPVALHLASKDNATNVIYLARPCQYSKLLDTETACPHAYWTNKRFAPDVIKAYHTALNEIKARYHIESFNLVGFSGGAAVAGLLAAERDDILTLRTVAGNLDHKAHSDIHEISYLEGSLNPVDYADKLVNVPQRHFIGGQDKVVPPGVLHSYLQAVGPSKCVSYKLVQEAAHDEGWVGKWPELLAEPVACQGPMTEPALTFEPLPEPIRVPRERPAKP